MKPKSSTIDLINGPIFGSMVAFSMPIIFQGSFQIIYNLTNRFWVGLLPEGKDAIGSVSVGFPIFFFMLSLVFGIAMGAGIMIAQYRGAGNRAMVNLTSRNFMVVGSVLIVLISIVMTFSIEYILKTLMNTPAVMLDDAVLYMKWMFIGFIFMYSFNALTGIFRGLGDSSTPLKVAGIIMVVNVVLDPIFIFGLGPMPKLGVMGAAQATILSYLIGTIILLSKIKVYREWVDLTPNGFRLDWPIIKEILRLGLPTGATMVIVSLSMMFIQRFVNDIGEVATAAFGVCIALDGLLMMPAQSFSQSMSAIAGQNIGAGKWDRVDKYLKSTMLVSLLIAVVVGGLLVLNIEFVSKAYLRQEGDFDLVFPLVKIYFEIMMLRFVMMSLFFPIIGAIRGAGDTMMSMFLVMFTELLIRIPLAVASQRLGYGFAGLAFAMAITTVLGLAIALVYYRLGRWKNFTVIKKNVFSPT